MKNIEVIRQIVAEMDEARFEAIQNAEYDYWEIDSQVSRKGYKRLVYHLSKVGLTVAEWFAWCAD